MLPFKRGFTVGFLSIASFQEREKERGTERETPRETDRDREARKEEKRHGEEGDVGRKRRRKEGVMHVLSVCV